MSDRWMRTTEAAKHSKLSASYLEKLRVTGGGPPYSRIGKVIVYDTAQLNRWMESRTETATSGR